MGWRPASPVRYAMPREISVVDIPSGTYTFLFTDVEGSTNRWNRDPDTMRRCLRLHDDMLRKEIETRGGRVFKTVGDAFCAAFSDPVRAAECAGAIQWSLAEAEWPGDPLRVRIGLHTGAAEERDGDFFGPAVNKVARICAAGSGGQILASEATRTMAAEAAPAEIRFIDLGPRVLKGFETPERLYQLAGAGLETDFPALSAPVPDRTNLPRELTSFVGRSGERIAVLALLGSARLVTLAGPGGVGKTRLALNVAASVEDRFPDGRWLVELATLSEEGDAAAAVAAAMGFDGSVRLDQEEDLAAYLSGRSMLLVLDNCEHLVEACARLVERLLRAGPLLSVLATSREPLGVPGESVYRVPPMPVPGVAPGDGTRDAGSPPACDSLLLFAARAAAVRPGFELRAGEAFQAAVICARLDGMPLAIELAAAKLRYHSLADLAAMLAGRFDCLESGVRAASPRQRTLRALFDWSWDLLDDTERRTLARLSAFRGTFAVEDAVAVAGGECVPALERLIEKSLVSMDDRGGSALYSMLGLVREYAAGRAAASGEDGPANDALAEHLAAYLPRVAREMRGPSFAEATRAILIRIPTIESCLDRCEARDDARGLAIAGASGLARLRRGDHATLLARCDAALRYSGDAASTGAAVPALEVAARILADSPEGLAAAHALATRAAEAARGDAALEARAARILGTVARTAAMPSGMAAAAALGLSMGDSERLFRDALALARAAGDVPGAGDALVGLGYAIMFGGDAAAAAPVFEEAFAGLRSAGDTIGVAGALQGLAICRFRLREYAKALKAAAAGMDAASAIGDHGALSVFRFATGSVALVRVDEDPGALVEAERIFRIIREDGLDRGSYRDARLGTLNLIPVLAALGRADECGVLARERAAEPRTRGNPSEAWMMLRNVAFCVGASGDAALSARCFGALASSRSSGAETWLDPADEAIERYFTRGLRGAIGDIRFGEAWDEGLRNGLEATLRSLDGPFPGLAALADSVAAP